MSINTIIQTLSTEAHDAASAGYDYIDWYATEDGALTEDRPQDGYRAEAYFDDADPSNLGWAYRITPIRGGESIMDQQESGSLSA